MRGGTKGRELFLTSDAPAPGSYNVGKDILKHARTVTFQKSKDTTRVEKKPGPGAYNPKINLVKPSTPRVDIRVGGSSGREFFMKNE